MRVAETDFEAAGALTGPELFEMRVAESPERIGVRSTAEDLTFGEWHLRTAGVRQRIDELGSLRGERVALWMTNDDAATYVCALQAVFASGAIAVMLDDRLAVREAQRILKESDPRALLISRLVSDRLGAAGLRALGATGLDPSAMDGQIACFAVADGSVRGAPLRWDASMTAAPRPSVARAGDNAMIAYTSGSTGRPKGALWTQAALCQYAERVSHATYADPRGAKSLSDTDVLQSPIPLYTAASVIENLYPAILAGCAVVYEGRRFDPAASEQRIVRYSTTVYNGTPAHYALMCELPEKAGRDPELIVSAGSAITPALYRRMRSRWPSAAIANWYGLNESGTGQTLNYGVDMERYPGSIGRPVWPTEIRVVDGGGAARATGQAGELWMRAPGQLTEYFRNPEQTAERLARDWLRTGDEAFVDDSGLIHIVGRGEERINRGGFKFYPVEIEAVLAEHDAVREAAVIAVPHPLLGQDAVAFVVTTRTIDAQTLRAHCRERIAANKVPAKILFLDELPRGAYGKVVRRELVGLATDDQKGDERDG